jgi:hypothetical protein
MSVFGNKNYAQQPVARTPDYVKAAGNSAYVQQMNAENKRADKQENLEGMGMMANSLREGGMLEGAVQAFKAGYAGSAAPGVAAGTTAGANAAMTGAAAASPYAAGATIPGAGMVAGGGGLGAGSALAGSTAAATAPAAGAATGAAVGGGLGAGATAALASNPVGWAALAALAAYSLFG